MFENSYLYLYSSLSSDPPIPQFWWVNSPLVQIFFSWFSKSLDGSISAEMVPPDLSCTFNKVSFDSWVDPFLTIKKKKTQMKCD